MLRRTSPIVLVLAVAATVTSAADFRAQREASTRARLLGLLAPFGIGAPLPSASLPASAAAADARPRAWREVQLDWSRPRRADVLQKREVAADRRFTILNERAHQSTPAQSRSLSLSEGQILVVATDGARRIKWWTTIADPRVVRYETGDEHGQLVDGGTVYRDDVRFSVDMPDDPEVSEVQVFHPRWTGETFELESLAATGRTAR